MRRFVSDKMVMVQSDMSRTPVNGQIMGTVGEKKPNAQTPETVPQRYDNTTLSTIIRFHKKERMPFLEEALFSLAIQDWHDIEPIIVLQNGTEELRDTVAGIIDRQPWAKAPRHKILSISIPAGMDGRSTLMNYGIKSATGRYLSFLDDDDVVYQRGYATLIKQLIESGRPVAVGGCRTALAQNHNTHWFIQAKEMPYTSWGSTRLDLFRQNFVPIHSYVIDRSRIGEFELRFDDAFPPLEDYDFLLRLCAVFEPDFSQLGTPVCEYRIRLDGSNSIPYSPNASPAAVAAVERARQLIIERKKEITCLITISEAAEFSTLLAERDQLPFVLARHVSRFLRQTRAKTGTFVYRYPWLRTALGRTSRLLLGSKVDKLRNQRF